MSTMAEVLTKHQWYDATNDREDPATGCTGCPDWFGSEDALDDGTFAAHQADVLAEAGYGDLSDAETQAYAKVIARIELGTPYMVNEKYVAGANWVRSQIEDVLAPAIEGAPGAEK